MYCKQQIIWVLMLILIATTGTVVVCSFTNDIVSIGPTNITRRAGEAHVVFICPSVDGRTPIWKINGLTHATSDLLKPFVPVFDNLVIPSVNHSMEGFTFQCFIRHGNDAVPSSIGTLHVPLVDKLDRSTCPKTIDLNEVDNLDTCNDITPLQQPEVKSGLHFDNRHFEFNKRACKISWTYSDDTTCKLNSSNGPTFQIRGWQCSGRLCYLEVWNESISHTTTEISIAHDRMISNHQFMIITIEAISQRGERCASLDYGIQVAVNESETELLLLGINDKVCVPVPNRHETFPSAVWPLSPDSMGEVCTCPLCNSSNAGCDINTCHCINITAYTVSIDENNDLCFHNMTLEMNSTYVNIFYDLSSRCAGKCQLTEFPTSINRLYVKSYWFLVELPAVPELTIKDDKICFHSESPANYPVESYELSIFDVTNERKLFRPHIQDNCTVLEGIFNDFICSPYEVVVKAYNEKGYSAEATHTVGNRTESPDDICTCLQSTVHPSIVSKVDVWTDCITIHVTCEYALQPPIGLGVALNVTLHDPNKESAKLISCTQAEQQNVTFCDLKQNSGYNYTVQRMIDSKPCLLLTDSFQTRVLTGTFLELTIAASIIAVLILIVIVTVILAIVVVKRRREDSTVTRFRNQN